MMKHHPFVRFGKYENARSSMLSFIILSRYHKTQPFQLVSKHTISPLPQFSRTLSVAMNYLFDLWWLQQQRHRFVFFGGRVQCQRFRTLQQLQWNQMFVCFVRNSLIEVLHSWHSTLQEILIFCIWVWKKKIYWFSFHYYDLQLL